jgi:hypothetical protein
MNMNDETFESAEALKTWLINRDVDSGKAAAACTLLFAAGYDQPSTLIGITVGELARVEGIANPTARSVSNKLKEQQQQDGE